MPGNSAKSFRTAAGRCRTIGFIGSVIACCALCVQVGKRAVSDLTLSLKIGTMNATPQPRASAMAAYTMRIAAPMGSRF